MESILAKRNPSDANPESILPESPGMKAEPGLVSIQDRMLAVGTVKFPDTVIVLIGRILCATNAGGPRAISRQQITKRKKPGELLAALASRIRTQCIGINASFPTNLW